VTKAGVEQLKRRSPPVKSYGKEPVALCSPSIIKDPTNP
jgi:hypothetical protein